MQGFNVGVSGSDDVSGLLQFAHVFCSEESDDCCVAWSTLSSITQIRLSMEQNLSLLDELDSPFVSAIFWRNRVVQAIFLGQRNLEIEVS